MTQRNIRSTAVALLLGCVFLFPTASIGHEFWLEPHRYRIEPGEPLQVDVRNGQDFVGTRFPYLPNNYRRFFIAGPSKRSAVDSRLGDYPALDQPVNESGLHMVVLESADNSVGYDDLDAFKSFLEYHGLEHVESVHRRRGLPNLAITESYSRFAKTLVQSGPVSPSGPVAVNAGLLFEIVPLQSPYLDSTSLPVTVQFQGQRLVNAQVEVFHRSKTGVTRGTTKTGADGVALLDVSSSGDYLINSVQLIQPRRKRSDIHWESLWASLTFRRE